MLNVVSVNEQDWPLLKSPKVYDKFFGGQGKSTALLSANINVLSTPPRLLVTR
jgi:hypothetical protein